MVCYQELKPLEWDLELLEAIKWKICQVNVAKSCRGFTSLRYIIRCWWLKLEGSDPFYLFRMYLKNINYRFKINKENNRSALCYTCIKLSISQRNITTYVMVLLLFWEPFWGFLEFLLNFWPNKKLNRLAAKYFITVEFRLISFKLEAIFFLFQGHFSGLRSKIK